MQYLLSLQLWQSVTNLTNVLHFRHLYPKSHMYRTAKDTIKIWNGMSVFMCAPIHFVRISISQNNPYLARIPSVVLTQFQWAERLHCDHRHLLYRKVLVWWGMSQLGEYSLYLCVLHPATFQHSISSIYKSALCTLSIRSQLKINQCTPTTHWSHLTFSMPKYFCINQWRPKFFFKFEIIIDVLVSSFHFI